MPGPNPYTGLASCVSLNTAAAVHLGKFRLTYQPGPEGLNGMELRFNGSLIDVPPQGINLGDGNTIANADQQGSLDIHAADGTHVIITPEFWQSQGYSYLNVEVFNTPAREGTMGHILGSDWLPLAPDGSSFGPVPASLADRHVLLNHKFADAWRVTNSTSLFDYAPGTSTADFTNRAWPPEPGQACITPTHPPVVPTQRELARQLCGLVKDKAAFENCAFDLMATGEAGIVTAYVRTMQLREAAEKLPPPGVLFLRRPSP
jgi:hypothetical protein